MSRCKKLFKAYVVFESVSETLCQWHSSLDNQKIVAAWNQYIPKVFANGQENQEGNTEQYISKAQISLLSIRGLCDEILKIISLKDSIRGFNRKQTSQNHHGGRFGT